MCNKREGNMKKFLSILNSLIAVFIFLFISVSSLRAEDVKIKIENGIQVVYNPKNPSPLPGTPRKLILREDLCIGDEEGEEYMFSQTRSVQVDEEENIYVLDTKEACVKVFDKNGKHLRTFGERGQGPGELQYPFRMNLVAGKEILIFDSGNRRLSFYSLQGKCLREISTGKYFFQRTVPDSKGNIITELPIPGDKPITEIKKFDPNLNPLVTIEAREMERTPRVMTLIYPVWNVRVMKNDNIVWGHPSNFKYEIFVVSPEGKTIRKIVKEYDPVKITKKDKEEVIKLRFGDREVPAGWKLEFPKNYYPYYIFMCGDEGRIYVRTYEQDKEGNYRYDVFDPDGRYIAKYTLSEIDSLALIRKNKMYTMVWEDTMGIPVVKRYSMIWK
jgi:hypothetical protein